MSPNPGQATGELNSVHPNSSVSPELVRKALSRAKRLPRRENEVVRINVLLSSLRRDPFNSRYETVSDNINSILRKTPNDSSSDPRDKYKVYSYSEMDRVLSESASNCKDLEEESLKREEGNQVAGQVTVDDQKSSAKEQEGKSSANQDQESKSLGFVNVFGWVKNLRKQDGGKLIFVILNDGSCKSNVQVIVHRDARDYPEIAKCYTGSSVLVRGFLIQRTPNSSGGCDGSSANVTTSTPSHNEGIDANNYQLLDEISNNFEIHVTRHEGNYARILGPNTNINKYPIIQKKITLEYLRENAHLRARTYTISTVMRVRNALAVGVHLFFQSLGLNYLNSPIITGSDCEGAGELFQITTLLENTHNFAQLSNKMGYNSVFTYPDDFTPNNPNNPNLDNEDNPNPTTSDNPNTDNKDNTEQNKENKEKDKDMKGIYVKNNKISYKNDFFKKKSYLTCSGQLSAENFCCSMGSVYTFGPTFRAENSHTNRHLAEFWMIEPEFLLSDLSDLMDVSERFVKFLVGYVLQHNYDDLRYLNDNVDDSLLERLNNVLSKSFVHISYTEVIEILLEHVNPLNNGSCTSTDNKLKEGLKDNNKEPSTHNESKELKDDKKFDFDDIKWGMDLQSEHERFICEKVFNCPVIIYNYPKKIKAFYMRLNDDLNTVAAMDLIIPKIGELIGGSQREERLDYLIKSIKDNNLDEKDYWWYLDLRRYGTVTHSGFGLGFERLVMMVTGVANIRDVIPFPRYPGHSSF